MSESDDRLDGKGATAPLLVPKGFKLPAGPRLIIGGTVREFASTDDDGDGADELGCYLEGQLFTEN